jgi:hypothetical protein
MTWQSRPIVDWVILRPHHHQPDRLTPKQRSRGTLELGGQKNESAAKLIEDATAGFDSFREQLATEFKTLTAIGNNFRIRHYEHDKADLPGTAGVDYVFISSQQSSPTFSARPAA